MGDTGEVFEGMREASQQKRANNRERSKEILIDRHIKFDVKNEGAHLIVYKEDQIIDFWPGTGKYKFRNANIKGRGIFNLLKILDSSIKIKGT